MAPDVIRSPVPSGVQRHELKCSGLSRPSRGPRKCPHRDLTNHLTEGSASTTVGDRTPDATASFEWYAVADRALFRAHPLFMRFREIGRYEQDGEQASHSYGHLHPALIYHAGL